MAEAVQALFGRRPIYTTYDEITAENLVDVLSPSLIVHSQNSSEIDYLWKYMKGRQPILDRIKEIRPEICNKTVENHAYEIAQFTSGYFMGKPCSYVSRGIGKTSADGVAALNNMMFAADKDTHDKRMTDWMTVCGVGYRMILPSVDDSDVPFILDTPDPRYTFIVYHAGFANRRMMSVQQIVRNIGGEDVLLLCGYTRTHYFEVEGNKVLRFSPHVLGDIPVFEYHLNAAMMGSFEPALSILDAINNVASNRLDGIEQFVQSFIKFINCDIDEEKFKALKDMGAILITSHDGQVADVAIVSQELNQQQTQTLVDYLYDQLLNICGLPTTTKGGASTC